MKELAKNFWAVLSLFSYIFRMMIITNWIRICSLILWEQQLWDWRTALITCPYPHYRFQWSVGWCIINPQFLNFKFCMQNFFGVVLGKGLQSLGQILSLWNSRFTIAFHHKRATGLPLKPKACSWRLLILSLWKSTS